MNSRNYMKMEKFATFVKKNFKINMLKIEKLLGTTVVIQGNIEMPHSICNLKYSVLKQI